jgi:hypothetical protein
MLVASSNGAAAGAAVILIVIFLTTVGAAVGFGFGTKAIMENRGRSGGWGFVMGFFLGLIGLIIALCLGKTPQKKAEEMAEFQQYMSAINQPPAPAQTTPAPAQTTRADAAFVAKQRPWPQQT